jgi:hypothetical protein
MKEGAYHYVFTLRTPNGQLATNEGSITVNAGATRRSVFQGLLQSFREMYGVTNLVVMRHSIEPE